MIIPIIILFVVFFLIALRQISNARLQIFQIMWLRIPLGRTIKLEICHIMLFGALAVLLTGQITPIDAAKSVNLDVMLFLFFMFMIGQALEKSGYLSYLSYRLFRNAKYSDRLLILILFGMGLASAVLMNDTLAIIGTPIVIILAKSHSISAKPLLLALAFAITIGGAMSPIGNPQNFLIATGSGIQSPFITFFSHLLIPTIINLLAAYLLLKFFYKDSFNGKKKAAEQKAVIKDPRLAYISKISLALLVSLVLLKIALALFGIDFRLTYIAIIASIPILLLSRKRLEMIKGVDWSALVFFASMFVLMESVWQTGFFQGMILNAGFDMTSIIVILLISVVISQFISNVPLVALYLPMLAAVGATPKEFIALAAGSTIAGNLLILGAASNVIIIQNAEKKFNETITFWEFARIGVPLTAVNVLVYWLFLTIL